MPAIVARSSYTPGFSSAEQSGLAAGHVAIVGRGMARSRRGSCALAAISDVEKRHIDKIAFDDPSSPGGEGIRRTGIVDLRNATPWQSRGRLYGASVEDAAKKALFHNS